MDWIFTRNILWIKQDERLGLFVLLADSFGIRSALYPGSFTHLTPAFVFPTTCFVDTDRRAARFFEDPAVLDLVGAAENL